MTVGKETMQADMSKAGKKRLTRSIRIIKTAAAAKYNAPSTAFSHGLLVNPLMPCVNTEATGPTKEDWCRGKDRLCRHGL